MTTTAGPGTGTGTARVGGRPIPDVPDRVRMRAEQHARLQAQLERQGLDGLLLLNSNPVGYATGAEFPGADSARAGLLRTVAVVVKGEPFPHLYTPYPEGAPAELPADHLHPPVHPDIDEGAAALARALAGLLPAGSRLAADDLTHPLARALDGYEVVSAGAVLGPARLCKTPDELACIRQAQRINELAMALVYPLVRPGVRQTELSGAFLRAAFELGATANGIDPIWQVMSPTRAEGPWTTHGGLAFPTPTTDRILRRGDVVWVDSGLHHHGYASDFGRTWIVDVEPAPDGRQRALFERWLAVMEAVLDRLGPGATGADLTRAARAADGGSTPWIDHFYLAHGVGTESAEPPMIGTDLGEAADEATVLAPGMVLVLEPAVWDEGAAGYRSEDIYAVTDDGWVPLSDHPFDPYTGRTFTGQISGGRS